MLKKLYYAVVWNNRGLYWRNPFYFCILKCVWNQKSTSAFFVAFVTIVSNSNSKRFIFTADFEFIMQNTPWLPIFLKFLK